MKGAASPLVMNSLPLEGKVPRRGGQGTGGMKESGEMRLKCIAYESNRAPRRFETGDFLVSQT